MITWAEAAKLGNAGGERLGLGKSHRGDYTHEMSDDDHRVLRECLENISGMAIVSGYPSGLYDELYGDWSTRTKSARTMMLFEKTECLWISPAADREALPLFEAAGVKLEQRIS